MPVLTEPEWLGRKDAEHGRWDVMDCEPRRGLPGTSIVTRQMVVPTGQNDMERVIRAHEMMHAKVSPAGDWDEWKRRGLASERALTVCEELRVNYLIGKAGFDVDLLSDGSETSHGEQIAQHGTWADAVYGTIAYANSGGLKPYLNGIRRHKREWGKALVALSKKAVKAMDTAYAGGRLASTEIDKRTGLHPYGFSYVEKLAIWIDSIAKDTPEEEEEKKESDSNDSSSKDSSSEESKKRSAEESEKRKTAMESKLLDSIKGSKPEMGGGIPSWTELRLVTLPMPKQTRGNLGKKRVASNIGRSPRRLHRLMTDPEKRVFDKVTRGMGGIVVVDASGSMRLTHDDVRRIVEASPGATVAAYSDMMDGGTNAWVLADNGKMVDEMPTMFSGNGVDYPMLEWAVKRRKRNEPIIWVTDGAVCGADGKHSEPLLIQCVNYVLKHNIIILPDTSSAICELHRMQNGNKARRQWGHYIKFHYKNVTGNHLVDSEV